MKNHEMLPKTIIYYFESDYDLFIVNSKYIPQNLKYINNKKKHCK